MWLSRVRAEAGNSGVMGGGTWQGRGGLGEGDRGWEGGTHGGDLGERGDPGKGDPDGRGAPGCRGAPGGRETLGEGWPRGRGPRWGGDQGAVRPRYTLRLNPGVAGTLHLGPKVWAGPPQGPTGLRGPRADPSQGRSPPVRSGKMMLSSERPWSSDQADELVQQLSLNGPYSAWGPRSTPGFSHEVGEHRLASPHPAHPDQPRWGEGLTAG